MSVTIDDIEALRRVLTELPRHQPKEVSKQDAIALLASELGAARRRGYTPDELARIFSERGVDINAATLRTYLRRNRKSRRSHDSKAAIDQRGRAAPPPLPASTEPENRTTPPTTASQLVPAKAPAAGAIPRGREPVGTQAGVTQESKPSGNGPGATNAQAGSK